MTTTETTFEQRFAAAWNELLDREADVSAAVARREGAQRRYDALLQEKRQREAEAS